MAFALNDRVRESSSSIGTGAMALAGAVLDHQGFAAIGDGNETWYCIVNKGTGEWEVGRGTYTASGQLFSRDEVFRSSNANGLVVFTSGIKEVFSVLPADALADLIADLGEVNVGRNEGTDADGVGMYLGKEGLEFIFRRVNAGANISFDIDAETGALTIIGQSSSGRYPGGIRRVTEFPYFMGVDDKSCLVIFDTEDEGTVQVYLPEEGWNTGEFADMMYVGLGTCWFYDLGTAGINREGVQDFQLAVDEMYNLVKASDSAPQWTCNITDLEELPLHYYPSRSSDGNPQMREDRRWIGGVYGVQAEGDYPLALAARFPMTFPTVYLQCNAGGSCDVQINEADAAAIDGFGVAVGVTEVRSSVASGHEIAQGVDLTFSITNAVDLEWVNIGIWALRTGNGTI